MAETLGQELRRILTPAVEALTTARDLMWERKLEDLYAEIDDVRTELYRIGASQE